MANDRYETTPCYYHGRPASAEDIIREMDLAEADMALIWQNPAATAVLPPPPSRVTLLGVPMGRSYGLSYKVVQELGRSYARREELIVIDEQHFGTYEQRFQVYFVPKRECRWPD